MKRKFLCMLLAGCMVFSLTTCGEKDPGDRDNIGDTVRDDGYSEPAPGPVPGSDQNGTDPSEAPGEESAGPGDDERGATDEQDPEPAPVDMPAPPAPADTDYCPTWFEDELQKYLEDDCGWSGRSYMVSPASFQAAMALAIEGASGETKAALLQSAGFKSQEEMERWYSGLLGRQMDFMDRYEALKSESMAWGDGSDPGMAFDIANAVWDNLDRPGGFTRDYADAIAKKYGAKASGSDAAHITGDVNAWCDEATHGMIKSIANDLSEKASVLANALYIKSAWRDKFSDYYTADGDFTRADGGKAPMSFMHQAGDFRYYKDRSGREYAMFALEGDIWLTACLDTDVRVQDLFNGMYNAEYNLLDVKMPKLDLETELSSELDGFVKARAGIAFTDGADFSGMTDSASGWHIDSIAQKTRIKTDEDGLEAAAVTMIAMADNAAPMDPVEPIEFHMDKPFSFLITAGRFSVDSDCTVLFFGQYAG